jgi:Tol biopolymer transport system component
MFAVGVGPPAVSPDGRHIAFVAVQRGQRTLWVRDLDSVNARMLPGAANAVAPFWAPDSRQIGFFASGKLQKIDVVSGDVTSLAPLSGNLVGGAWGREIVFTPGGSSRLFRVSPAGGNPVPVTQLDLSRGEIAHRKPNFLPDGRHFLFLAAATPAERTAIWVGDLDSAEKKMVVQSATTGQYANPGYILFARGDAVVAQPFSTGKLQTTGEPTPIAERVDSFLGGGYGYFGVCISRSGRRSTARKPAPRARLMRSRGNSDSAGSECPTAG